jgi:hypothetical protein
MVEGIGNGTHAQDNRNYSTSLGLIILGSSKSEVNKRLQMLTDVFQVERGRMRTSMYTNIYQRWLLP